MAKREEIMEVMMNALADADDTHAKPKGRRLNLTLGEGATVASAIIDALVAAGLLSVDKDG